MKPAIPTINVIVEGITDEAVVCRLLEYVGLTCGKVYGKKGRHAHQFKWANWLKKGKVSSNQFEAKN